MMGMVKVVKCNGEFELYKATIQYHFPGDVTSISRADWEKYKNKQIRDELVEASKGSLNVTSGKRASGEPSTLLPSADLRGVYPLFVGAYR